jgi:predicted transport protein
MPKSPDELANTMIANFKEKTGKTLEQWIAIAKKSGAAKHGDIMKLLKGDYGMTHGFANLVALKTLKSDAASMGEATDLVAAQYAGEKAALKPIYDALIKLANGCGAVEVAPKKAYVSLRRNKQFAIIQPSTKTRVDLGLNLKNEPATDRLEKSGSFNAMVSHRVRIEKVSDVDRDIEAWMKIAWSNA